jgi:hypothetical protein
VRKFGILFGAVSLLALCASPAVAGPFGSFDGVLSGDYANTSLSGAGHANDWSFDGAGAFNLGWSNIAVQAEGGWHDFNGSHTLGNWNDWNAGGALYWTGHWARVGATAGYQSENGGLSGHATNYGGFGELYAGPIFTLGVKGGGFSGNGGLSGGNVGVQGVLYFWREIALSGSYDYYNINGLGTENDWGGKLEWLISPRLPVSIWGGFEHDNVGGIGHANSWLVGLKFYTDSFGPAPLIERQRGGAEQWGTTFTPAGFVY